jgi:hypothetical protein
MGLKFRRGTNAQKSGSLAFGEPYVNTDLGTLQIGGLTGDITLGASGTGSQGSFAGISGSSLDITGNAKIDGNLTLGGTITIGDASTDNVVVNADLSSSIIPNDDNAFDLGSTSKRYRAIHGTNIYGTINATNGVISGSSQLNTLATTGSNTFKGNQTIIGSGAGFAAYISTSVNDATLGLDTTANVNALYFLKNGEKNFELSYDTTNANGIFRLLPYDNNSFFEIGNPSNSGANYVFISEPTYGNVLIGPGIGNGVSSLVGSTPATDKVQVTGNLYVSGAINANSFTGSIASTNGVVSGSSQVDVLSTTNIARLATTGSNIFVGDQTVTGSLAINDSATNFLIEGNGFSQTYLTSNGAIVLNPGYGGVEMVGSYRTFKATDITADGFVSGEIRANNGVISGSSQITLSSTTGFSAYSTSVDSRITTEKGRVDAILLAADADKDSFAEIVTLINSVDTTNDTAFASFATSSNATNTAQSARLSSLETYTGSNDTTNTAQNSRLTTLESVTGSYETKGRGIVSGSSQIVGSSITTNTITIGSTAIALGGTATTIAGLTSVSSTGFTGALTGNASTATTLATARTINGTSFNGSADITIANLVSGSSQIAIASVSGYDANRWVDHTAVSISAGNGLSGGGTIAATRTLSLDTTSATFTTGVTTQNNALGVVSGSRTISGITLGSNLATLTIGTGLSGTSYNGSTGVTIANTGVLSVTTNTGLSSNVSATGNVTITNTGVTSNVAGTGISLSGGTGAVTITNSGVTSNVAGTGISLSGGTGAVTITNSGVTSLTAGTGVSVSGATGGVTVSIGQAVATSSNVQFNSLGIGMAASATAGRIDATNDIVAYSSSDIRFKENIKPIENALQKISKISGNTYDWKAENKIEHGYEGNDVGVIAQEIEEVLPQLVQTRDNGYKAVKYDKLVALLIEGIKEQQTQIHSLTIEIEKLKESKGL